MFGLGKRDKPHQPPVVILGAGLNPNPTPGNPIQKQEAGMFGQDGTMRGLGEVYGERDWRSRTYGTPARTVGVGMMEAFAWSFGFPELAEAARQAASSWKAEEGRDTEWLIRAVGAAKAQPPAVQFGNPPPR